MNPDPSSPAEEPEREDEPSFIDSASALRTRDLSSPEERLWYEVLLHNMRDFRWIGTRDFKLVCSYANIDPSYIMRKLYPLLPIKKSIIH